MDPGPTVLMAAVESVEAAMSSEVRKLLTLPSLSASFGDDSLVVQLLSTTNCARQKRQQRVFKAMRNDPMRNWLRSRPVTALASGVPSRLCARTSCLVTPLALDLKKCNTFIQGSASLVHAQPFLQHCNANDARLELHDGWTRGVLAASRVPRRNESSRRRLAPQHWIVDVVGKSTYLIVDLVGWDFEADSLFEDAALLLELNTLGPVVESTGNVNFFRGVFPGEKLR